MQKGGKSLATGLRLFFIFAALVTPGRGGPWRLSQVQYIQQHQFKLEESISIGPGRTTSSSRCRKRPEGPEEALELPSVEVERSSRGRGIRTTGEVHQQRTRRDHQHQERQRHQDSRGGPSVEDQEGPPAPVEAKRVRVSSRCSSPDTSQSEDCMPVNKKISNTLIKNTVVSNSLFIYFYKLCRLFPL